MVIIGNKYEISELIGEGTFGKIYKGKNIRTKEEVAIKIEVINSEMNSLKHETKIYQYLNGNIGIPSLKWYGTDLNHRYMVMSLLGDNLYQLVKKHSIFSLQVTIQIGIQALQIIEKIHEMGLIHRDIKPDNFLFGINENKHQLFLIDFGICKRYTNDNGEHIKMNKIKKIIGSFNYCSINSHLLNELSRRDDLEMLGYVLINILSGSLLWETLSNENEIMKRKLLLTSNIKIPGIPDIFIVYLNYVKNLEFDAKPDYEYIKNLFINYQDK
jgi:casein kinase I family protein HRR25